MSAPARKRKSDAASKGGKVPKVNPVATCPVVASITEWLLGNIVFFLCIGFQDLAQVEVLGLVSCYQAHKHTVLVLRLEASVIPVGGIENYMDKTFRDEAGAGK